MHLEIITPQEKLFTGEVRLVQLPGSLGSFEILNNHAPIISSLKKGAIKVINPEGLTKFFEIEGGIIEAKQNNIIILAESAKPE
jgi:F-type H+-transporting ATPase subunit epsilon